MPLNQSEANLRVVLEDMSKNISLLVPSNSFLHTPHDDLTLEETTYINVDDTNTSKINDCVDVPTDSVIIVNMLGRLANNLFEVAFAKRLAEQLGCRWDVIYRSYWAPAFPTHCTDVCFPNALSIKNNRHGGATSKLHQIKAIQDIEATFGMPGFSVSVLYQALTYNELEPEKHKWWDNIDDWANNMTMEWIKSLGETALRVDHMDFPLHDDHVYQLVLKLSDPASPVRVVSLGSFFIHFDWMHGWMDQISNWLCMEPSCCCTQTPSEGMIVIHIRDFEPDDKDMNNNLQVGVY
jgi:hypothetical protein